MNKKLLRSIMTLYGETYDDLATLLNLSRQSIVNKINERGSEFKQGEIAKIREHYCLSPDQVADIFFK